MNIEIIGVDENFTIVAVHIETSFVIVFISRPGKHNMIILIM